MAREAGQIWAERSASRLSFEIVEHGSGDNRALVPPRIPFVASRKAFTVRGDRPSSGPGVETRYTSGRHRPHHEVATWCSGSGGGTGKQTRCREPKPSLILTRVKLPIQFTSGYPKLGLLSDSSPEKNLLPPECA
jgi:hypothetical protein